jgi:hypothetical protein
MNKIKSGLLIWSFCNHSSNEAILTDLWELRFGKKLKSVTQKTRI